MISACCRVSSVSSETQACRPTAGKAAAYIDDNAKTPYSGGSVALLAPGLPELLAHVLH
jgi:hypothetical protein